MGSHPLLHTHLDIRHKMAFFQKKIKKLLKPKKIAPAQSPQNQAHKDL